MINEFVANHVGTDANEFIEVLGTPNTNYSALTVIEIEGDSGGTVGVIDRVFPVGTTNANGYWQSVYSTAIENGTISLLLVQDFTGAVGNDLDTNDDGVLDVTPWSLLADGVSVWDGGATDRAYGLVTLGVSFDGQPFAPGGASRVPDGADLGTTADWMRNDFDGAGLPGFAGTPALGEALNTPLASNMSVPLINEMVINTVGTDTNEFVEVLGEPDVDYSGLTLIEIEGDATSAVGTVDEVITLGLTDLNGYWTTGYLNNALENGTITLLLVQGFTGALGADLDTDNNGVFDVTPWTVIVDSIAINDGGATDVSYSTLILLPNFDGNTNAVGGASRIPNGVDTNAVADWMRNDYDGAGLPSFTGTPIAGEAFNTPLAINMAVPTINEFVANHTSTDTHEFVEILGGASTDYSTFTILEIEGDSTAPGVVDEVLPITSTNASGYWTTGFLNNAIENGTVSLLLVQGFTGALNDDLDTNNDGIFDVTPWTAIIDGVAVNDNGVGDFTYATPALLPNFDGMNITVGGASRIPNGVDTNAIADWTRNDFDGAGLPGFTGTPDVGEALNTPLADNEAVAPDLTVVKTGPSGIIAGDDLVYTIQVQNFTALTATAVIITDTLPVSTTYVSDSSGLPVTNPAPGVYAWSIGDINPLVTYTLQLTVTSDPGITFPSLTNNVVITTTLAGDDPINNSDSWITSVIQSVTIYDVQFVPDPVANDASPYAGQTVAVEGIVTAEPGDLDTPTRAFVIEQPGGGPWSGLTVYYSGGFGALVAPPGAHVRVVGQVQEYFGMTELVVPNGAAGVTVLSTGNPVPGPDVLATAAFDDVNKAVSEQWESVYIQFEDAVVTDTSLGFGEWYFDDGSGNARANDLGGGDGDLTYAPVVGDQLVFVRGIGYYSFNNYKLEPRSNDDIVLLATEPVIYKEAPAFVAPGSLYTYTITVENGFVYPLTNVLITDSVPANATFAYALDGGSESGGLVSWNIPTLDALTSIQVRFAVTATTELTTVVNANYAVSASNFVTPTFGAPLATIVDTQLRIHHIQGAQHFSSLEGQTVSGVEGIVTAVRALSFYIQEPDATQDDDPETSEGIQVFSSTGHSANVGDLVSVSGLVQEFYTTNGGSSNLSVTELRTTPAQISVISSGNPLPSITVIGIGGNIPPIEIIEDDANGTVDTDPQNFDPEEDGIDFYESMEGMLVQVNNAQVVGATRSFDEIAIVADSGISSSLMTPRGGIVIQETDYNPERLIVDAVFVSNPPQVPVGVTFDAPIVGVIDYDYLNYKLYNTQPLPTTSGTLAPETTSLAPGAGQLTFATFNVENLDPSDGARFNVLAQEIVTNMGAPDIIGLEEIQDNNGETNNGVVDASLTYQTLINAIVTAGGPTYEWRDIAPVNNEDGGAPGANIRVGFLFRTDRGVSFVDRPGGTATAPTSVAMGATGVELSFSPGRIDPQNTAFNDSRKPLVGEFLFNGRKLFVIANHLNSKGGDDGLFGRFQPPILYSEVQRVEQATVINAFVQDILAIDSEAMIAVVGDFNDFQFSNPIITLMGDELTDLLNTLPAEERYTYVYDGNSQALDHLLVSEGLLALVNSTDVVHANAEFPEVNQATDHDPIVALATILPANVQFGAADYSVAEDGATATITVTLDAVLAVTATVDYASSDGTAIAGTDYTAASGTLIFAPGEASATIDVAILDDNLYEGNETVLLDLSNPVNATLGTPISATLTIVDDETEPTVQLSSATYSIGEADGSAVITVTLSGASAFTAMVDYATIDGTAVAGDDYTAASGTLTFAPGETSATFNVAVLDDNLYEGDEIVLLDLSNPVSATLGTPASATLTIVDDETEPTVQLSSAAYSVGEADGSAVITVTLSGVSVFTATVDYATSDGTAVDGADYTAASGTLIFAPGETSLTFNVAVLDDSLYEGNETVLLDLGNPVNTTLGTPASATLTIVDDETEPTIQLSSAAYSVGEADGSAVITVTMIGTSAFTTTVDYATSDGTAIDGTDYTAISGTLTFAPGETSATFEVAILDNSVDEADRDFNVAISNPVGASLGTPAAAVVTILDDDPTPLLPNVQLSAAAYSVDENAGTATLTATLDAASAVTVTVDYATSDGTAIDGTDYTAASGTLTFAPGETSATFEVVILDNSVDEADRDFNATLSNPANATLGTPSAAVVTILDDDAAPVLPTVQFSAAAYTVDENAGTATITVTLDAASAVTVTVNFATSDGTAVAGTDYTAASGTLTFAPGQTIATITVIILDNAAFSGDRALDITLSDPVEAELGTPGTATLTIVEDDPSGSVMYLPFIHK